MKISLTNMWAHIDKNTDLFGKMDPYVVISAQNECQRTSVIKKGGTKISWTDTVLLNVMLEETISFKIYDKDTFFDDFVGEIKLPVSELVAGPSTMHFSNKKNSGLFGVTITPIETACFPSSACGQQEKGSLIQKIKNPYRTWNAFLGGR